MARKLSRPPGRTRTVSTQKRTTTSARANGAAVTVRRRPEEELIENLFLGVLLFALAVLIFIPVFNAGFIWDDDQLLTANPQVHSPDGWWTLWVHPLTADYFPLTSTTLWFEWHLWGMNAGAYHVTNVLLHATTVVLTWQMLKRLRIPGAWVAAAIFAVHPVCVESVAWISERKNTISQIFFLLSMIGYVKFEEKGRLRTYLWAVACFTLSLLAKTAVVMLPFILLLLAWWRYRLLEPMRKSYELEKNPVERGILIWTTAAAGSAFAGGLVIAAVMLGWMADGTTSTLMGWVAALVGAAAGYFIGGQLARIRKWGSFAGFELIRMLPFFLVAFLLGVVTIYFQYGRAIGGEEIPLGNLWQRVASACFAVGFYLYSAFWPFHIIEIYPQWHRAFWQLITQPKPHMEGPAPESLPYWIQVIPGLIVGGVLVFCWMRRQQSWARAILVGLGCYILAMLPALGLLKMSYMRLTLVADHFQYISIVAVIALVVAAGTRRMMKPVWLAVAALFFIVVTYMNWGQTQENHIYELIWILGTLVLAAATMVPGIWKYVWGGFMFAVLVCSSIISFAQAGIYHGEESLWSATLEKNPNTWQGHNHLGAALYMRGDVKDAYPHFAAAVRLKPENPESHNNLGLALSMFGQTDEAIHQYETAVSIKDDSAMDTNLGNAYDSVKRYDDAIRVYKHALELNPENTSAHCNLGYALMQEGRIDEAIPHFMKTIEIDPQMPQGRSDLVQALKMKGINLDAPDLSRPYSFDLQKALQLLRGGPMPPQQMPP